MSRRLALSFTAAIAVLATGALAQQTPTDGPYKVLKTAKVGGEGGHDYIYADPVGRRLYIPRGAVRGAAPPAAAGAPPATPPPPLVPARLSVYNLDTLEPVKDVPDVFGNGAAVDSKSGHGFTSSTPVAMFDTKTLALIKKIDVNADKKQGDTKFAGDGIYHDPYDGRIYVFSHPTRDAAVIDPKEGKFLGFIDLGGVPEQAISDGKGTLYVVMQNYPSGVAVVDVKTMKTTAHYPFGENTGCNGLGLDAKNEILFAACSGYGQPGQRGQAGQPAPPPPPPANPPLPAGMPSQQMVILSAKDGHIITKLPLAGGSDGAVFNPATMEAFSSHSNGTLTIVKEKNPTTFTVEQNLTTMNGARTLTLDTKTNRVFVMSEERGPAPTPAPAAPGAPAGRGAQAPVVPGSFSILMIGIK